MGRLSIVLILSAVLIGCAGMKAVITQSTMFYDNSYQPVGSVHVVSGDSNVSNNSLEFKAYKSKLEAINRLMAEWGEPVVSDVGSAGKGRK